MKVIIETSRSFDKELKRFSKHYASFLDDLKELAAEIKANPNLGTDLGGGIRKIRMQIKSKGKGKSGGARVISVNIYATATETGVNLLYIYDKSERSTISAHEIEDLLIKNGLK